MTTPDPPLGPVLITGRDIYDAVVRLTGAVDRLLDQSKTFGEDLRDHEDRLRIVEATQPARRLTRLEDQVKALEANRWPLPALAALVSVAALILGILPYAG